MIFFRLKGASNLNGRIFNGDPADIADYPVKRLLLFIFYEFIWNIELLLFYLIKYLVSIEAPNENGDPTHLCGGFIYR